MIVVPGLLALPSMLDDLMVETGDTGTAGFVIAGEPDFAITDTSGLVITGEPGFAISDTTGLALSCGAGFATTGGAACEIKEAARTAPTVSIAERLELIFSPKAECIKKGNCCL